MSSATPLPAGPTAPKTLLARFLDGIEWAGNKLPDPALLFVIALLLTWGLSAWLSTVQFNDDDPRTLGKDDKGNVKTPQKIAVKNQLSPTELTTFLSKMVDTFIGFPPLGVVLVALLGVGVAEHTGFINAMLKGLLQVTPARFITPMLLVVAIVSHTAGDTGYVLVIPLGGVIFATAGRHPLAGIVAAFAGVSGGFSANFIPSGLDPLLQGFTQSAAGFIDTSYKVPVLCNLAFMACSSILIVAVGWYLTDYVIEPRLRSVPLDQQQDASGTLAPLTERETFGLYIGVGCMALLTLLLIGACLTEGSPLAYQPNAVDLAKARGNEPALKKLAERTGSLSDHDAPLMKAIVPLIFFFFLIPGIAYGYAAGTVKGHRDIFQGMSKAMGTMNYYLVLAFCAALFTYAFRESNLGALLAIKGAELIKTMGLPAEITVVGMILLAALVNLLIGSASAKWALLAPIFVPMLMQLGLSPELTQAAYRIGDSSTNIITPLMPYFPLIVVYAQRYVKSTGIGTLISLMLPYSLCFLATWTLLLLVFWTFGLPLGIPLVWGADGYTYP